MGFIKITTGDLNDDGELTAIASTMELDGLPPGLALGLIIKTYIDLYGQIKHNDCSDPICNHALLLKPAYEALKAIDEAYDAKVGEVIERRKYNQT